MGNRINSETATTIVMAVRGDIEENNDYFRCQIIGWDIVADDFMTEFEKQCYGMSEADIREQYMNSITAKFSGLEMVVMGILSDSQEFLVMDRRYTFKVTDRSEAVRQQLNIAKFILAEMMESKQTA